MSHSNHNSNLMDQLNDLKRQLNIGGDQQAPPVPSSSSSSSSSSPSPSLSSSSSPAMFAGTPSPTSPVMMMPHMFSPQSPIVSFQQQQQQQHQYQQMLLQQHQQQHQQQQQEQMLRQQQQHLQQHDNNGSARATPPPPSLRRQDTPSPFSASSSSSSSSTLQQQQQKQRLNILQQRSSPSPPVLANNNNNNNSHNQQQQQRVSPTGEKSNKAHPGTVLQVDVDDDMDGNSPQHIVHTIQPRTTHGSSGSRPKLSATPITKYNTDPAYFTGKQIATNANYMVYGMKGGLIRVINKYTAKRALLKGHKQQITDIKFMREDKNYLVSVSEDHTIIVWEIFEKKQQQQKKQQKQQQQDNNSGSNADQEQQQEEVEEVEGKDSSKEEDVVSFGVVLYIKQSVDQQQQSSDAAAATTSTTPTRYFKSVEWHPQMDFVLFARTNLNEIFAINIHVLRAHGKDRVCRFSPDIKGVAVLQPAQGVAVNAMDFSRDGQLFAAGYDDGSIKVWNAKDFALLKKWNAYEGRLDLGDVKQQRSIYSLNFCGSKSLRPTAYNYLIIGGHNNAEFMLARLDYTAGKQRNAAKEERSVSARVVQIVTLRNHDEESSGNSIMKNQAELDSSSSFLLVANTLDSALYVLHLGEYGGDKGSRFLFDYITEFDTEEPILSFATMTKVTDPSSNGLIIGLFCVQLTSMQLLHVTNEECYPSSLLLSKKAGNSNSINVSASGEQQQQQPAEEREEEDTAPSVATAVDASQLENDLAAAAEQLPPSPAKLPTPVPERQQQPSSPVSTGGASVAALATQPALAAPSTDLLQQIQSMLEKHSQTQYERLLARFEEDRKDREKQERLRQQQLLMTVSKAITTDLPDQMENAISKAMQSTVTPTLVTSALSRAIQQQLPQIVQSALRDTTERAFDKVGKTVEGQLNKIVADNLSQAIRKPINESFQSVLKSTVIPSFEQSCQRMFDQIGRAFDKGIDDRVNKPLKEFYTQMNNETVQLFDDRLKESMSELTRTVGRLSATAGAGEKEEGQSGKQKKDKRKANPMEEIAALLSQQKYEEAFTKALSLGDLSFVTWTCKQVNPDHLTSIKPSPLSQAVILSLIQQLGYDLTNDAELKIDWLQKIAMLLNPSDPKIAPHVPVLLGEVLDNLSKAYPTYASVQSMATPFKICMHIFNSLLRDAMSHAAAAAGGAR